MDQDLLHVVQSFHAKMDTGFARLHDRMDDQKNEISELKDEMKSRVCDVENVTKQHLSNHPDNNEVNDHLKEARERHADKREISKTIAMWSFRGVMLYVAAKFGLEEWFSG